MTKFWIVASAVQMAFLVWLMFKRRRLEGPDGRRLHRLWHRILHDRIPTAAEVEQLLGPAMELVVCATDPAAPEALDAAVARAEAGVAATRGLLDDWRLRTWLGLAPDEPVVRVPPARLRMRPLRLWAHVEGMVARVTSHPADLTWAHVSMLRRSLAWISRAQRHAVWHAPQARRRRLAELHGDLVLLVQNCVLTQERLREVFLRWDPPEFPPRAGGAPA